MRIFIIILVFTAFSWFCSCNGNAADTDPFVVENDDDNDNSEIIDPDTETEYEPPDDIPENITVEKVPVDYFTNCYLMSCREKVIVIDPGSKPELIEQVIAGRTVEFLLLTHGHFDHIMGLDELAKLHPDALIAIHELDRDFLYDPSLNMSSHYISVDHVFSGKIDLEFTDSDAIRFCGKDIKIIHLPGHTPGSSGFYFDDFVIDGDTLMYMQIGVIDLPHADKDQLIESIKTKLFTLNDDTIVYPGHGKSTTIGFEKENNPEFQ